MNALRSFLKFTLEAATLVLFAWLLVVVFQSLIPSATPAGKSTQAAPTVQLNEPNPYPGGTPYPFGTPEVFYESPTPVPSWTPYPTNTAKPGSTATPIPLLEPAKDASGAIFYIALEDRGNKVMKVFEVDAKIKLKTTPKKIFDNLPDGTYYPSPDGKYIVAISPMESGIIGRVLDVQSGKQTTLLENYPMSAFFGWYPDSKKILVSLLDYGLWLFDVDGKKPGVHIFQPNLGHVISAASSPDGKNIIYTIWHSTGGKAQTFIAESDGRNAIQIMETPYAPYELAWSPDGKQIAFLGDGLIVMNADGSDLRQLGFFPVPHCYSLTSLWSPDSKRLILPITSGAPDAFCQGWNAINFNGLNIVIIDVTTTQIITLPTESGVGNIDPSWSVDGKKIIFISNRNGSSNVWVSEVDGKDPIQLTMDSSFSRFPIWQKP